MFELQLRPYQAPEFEASCRIREIEGQERRDRWRKRFDASGDWDDHYLHLAIAIDGVLVGDLQLRHCSQSMPDGVLEIGLELDPAQHGIGIGTAVLQAASQKFFEDGWHRISGSTDIKNIAMKRAFEKAGWKLEGIMRGLFNEDGVLHDYASYAVVKV